MAVARMAPIVDGEQLGGLGAVARFLKNFSLYALA